LFERLPFEPAVVVAGVEGDADRMTATVKRLTSTFEGAGVFAALERPGEPAPSRLMAAGAAAVIRVPFHPVEVVQQLEAWFASRRPATGQGDTLRAGDLEIALDRYTAAKNGRQLVLTRLELRLLYCLAEHAPHLTPTERLLAFGWDALADPDPALLKTHVSHLRSKLREAGGVPIEITARQGLGYMLVPGGSDTRQP
jgi:two-component system KDP operon response regulator KdpE